MTSSTLVHRKLRIVFDTNSSKDGIMRTHVFSESYAMWLTLTLSWISGCIQYKMWNEIIYGASVDMWYWISYFTCILLGTGYLPMLGLKIIHVLVRGAPEIQLLLHGSFSTGVPQAAMWTLDNQLQSIVWDGITCPCHLYLLDAPRYTETEMPSWNFHHWFKMTNFPATNEMSLRWQPNHFCVYLRYV